MLTNTGGRAICYNLSGGNKGLGGIHIWHTLILLIVVLPVLGSKGLAGAGDGIGTATRYFSKAMRDHDASKLIGVHHVG